MPRETTYTHGRDHFAELCKQVVADRDFVIIRRRGDEDVALVAAAELSGLLETDHLLRSPSNARRLLRAIKRVT